jgi:dolichol kinase
MHLRKVIHICGVFIPLIALIFGKPQAIALIIFGFLFYLGVETLKPKINKKILSMVYRENELSGFSIEPFSYIVSVLSLLFLSYSIDEAICFASIAILAAGDGFAGVIGRRYGRHKFSFNRNKSWEGSLSGFAAASVAGFYYAGPIAIIGACFGMAAGALNKHDNIAVPYAALISMFLSGIAFSMILYQA